MTYSVNQIRIFTVFSSLLLSLFTYFTDDIINRDGALYVVMAQAYLDGGLIATAKLYDWPFFSILIAYTHKATSFSLENSAFLLNGLLFALFINTFLSISNKLVANSRQLVIAAILILCFGILNEYRDFIIRDIGYWAFCSLALYRFMLFIDKPTLRNATIWQVLAVISILFRIEGIAILLGLPLFLFTIYSPQLALRSSFKLWYILIIGLSIMGLMSIGHSGIADAFGKLSAASSYLNIEIYAEMLNHKLNIMGSQILNQFSEDYSGVILISGLLFMLAYKLLKGLSLTYLGIYIASYWQKPSLQYSPYLRLLYFFTVLNIIVLVIFVLTHYFISTRYCMMALVGLLLLLLPRLTASIETLWLKRNKGMLYLIGLLLFVGLIDSVTQSNSKAYIKHTAIWASQNLSDTSTVLANDEMSLYYYKMASYHQNNIPNKKRRINSYLTKKYQNYDYLIIIEKRKSIELKSVLNQMNIKPMHCEQNRREDKSCVYKVIH